MQRVLWLLRLAWRLRGATPVPVIGGLGRAQRLERSQDLRFAGRHLRGEEIVALQGLLQRKQMLFTPRPLKARRNGRRTRLGAPVAHRRQHLRVALPIDNRPQNPLTGHTHDVTDH